MNIDTKANLLDTYCVSIYNIILYTLKMTNPNVRIRIEGIIIDKYTAKLCLQINGNQYNANNKYVTNQNLDQIDWLNNVTPKTISFIAIRDGSHMYKISAGTMINTYVTLNKNFTIKDLYIIYTMLTLYNTAEQTMPNQEWLFDKNKAKQTYIKRNQYGIHIKTILGDTRKPLSVFYTNN